jgi:hypothetical protein
MSRSRRVLIATGAAVPPASFDVRVIVMLARAALAGLVVVVLGEMTISKNLPSDGFAGSSTGVSVRVSSVEPFGKDAI